MPLNKSTPGAIKIFAVGAALALTPSAALAQSGDLTAFRALYKELVEINTTLSAGDCTRAANPRGARLKAPGIPDADMRIIVPPNFPKQGNLVARLRGTDPTAKPMLLVGHL